MFFFSCIWSIGAVCDSETKKKFNLIFTELLKGELSEDVQKSLQLGALDVPPLETPYVFPPPKECDVFSYKVKSFWLIKNLVLLMKIRISRLLSINDSNFLQFSLSLGQNQNGENGRKILIHQLHFLETSMLANSSFPLLTRQSITTS